MRKEKDKQTQEDDVYCVSVIIVCQHTCVRVCVYACVCVCVRERERERKKREKCLSLWSTCHLKEQNDNGSK